MRYKVERIHKKAMGIETKYLPPTNTKSARIKASSEQLGEIVVNYEYASDGKTSLEQFYQAACALLKLNSTDNRFTAEYNGQYLSTKTGYVFIYEMFYHN